MNPDNLLRLANNFFYTHTYLSIAMAVILALMVFVRPKQTFKAILMLLGLLVIAYILYQIGQATMGGLAGKKQMLHK